MRVLRVFPSLVFVLFCRQVFCAESSGDICADGVHRLVADAYGVRTDVGNKALDSFAFDFNTLVQLLYDLHGSGSGKTQFSSCFLLHA